MSADPIRAAAEQALGATSPLPRGPHKIPREVVVDHQRQRLLRGAAQAMAEHGLAKMTVAHVIAAAGVSRSTFYENFDNKRGCVLAAHEQAFDRFAGDLARACAGASQWSAKVAVAVATTTVFAVRSPEQARLLIPDALAPDPVLIERALASNDYFIGLLRNGREECPGAASLPELTERALIGATVAVIGRRILHDQTDQLPELAPRLTHLILLPYVGGKEAARAAKAMLPPPGLTL